MNAACRGKKGVGRRDDRITGADPAGDEESQQGVRSRGHSNGMPPAQETLDFLLQSGDLRSENIAAMPEHPQDSLLDIGLDLRTEATQVKEWNRHG